MDLKEYHDALVVWLHKVYKDRLRPAKGAIHHPFVDPGADYEDKLWDWDAYFSCIGFAYLRDKDPAVGLHAKGCVDNFIEHQGADGHIPYCITTNEGHVPASDAVRATESPRNSSKPLPAQFALLVTDQFKCADAQWLKSIRHNLESHIQHWFDSQGVDGGLLTWRSHRGSGADNHPAYFQRPFNTVADPFLNCLMVRECRALAEIHARTGGDPDPWRRRAEQLSDAINSKLWDPIDETYYCIDLGHADPGPVRNNAHWVVPLKFRSYTMVMPLFTKIATPERARKIVDKFVNARDQLRSPHGIYSLAPCEPAYRLFADGNPSDWLGPVWVVSTYIVFRSLLNYGFRKEAYGLAEDHLACLSADYKSNGCLHEYYNPETGEGMTNPGFVNWNSCATLMLEELSEGYDTTSWEKSTV
ncbi:MAG: hypothetical protein GF344_14310 [Chitinivibrionales bacterium]|nr:hypothetical protein [Chitinivibrionales bacterium]MBD3357897.1 hypothetical protein [Chitinivibrionales bacterium]